MTLLNASDYATRLTSRPAMAPRFPVALPAGKVLARHNAVGERIGCVFGMLWITQEGDHRDYVVTPGQTLTVTHGGRTVIEAVEPALIEIHVAPAAAVRPGA